MNYRVIILLPILSIMIGGCGSSDKVSVQAVISSQQLEPDVQRVDCVAGAAGGIVPGFDGQLNLPLSCSITYVLDDRIFDTLAITISDVRVVESLLGSYLQIDGQLVYAYLTIFRQEQQVSGFVRFTEISNYSGEPVSAEFQLQTPDSQFIGSFHTTVTEGY